MCEERDMNEKKIGRHLAQMRKQKGMTQADMAHQLHITPQAISKWERGKSMPTFALLLRVCTLLDTSPDALFAIARDE